MLRRVLAGAIAALVFSGLPLTAAAAPTPTPSASPSPSPNCPDSDSSPLCVQKRALEKVQAKLSTNLATAQAAKKQVADSIDANARQQDDLRTRIDAAKARLEALDAEIVRLQDQIARLEAAIAHEQKEIRILARVIGAQPSSALAMAARSPSLGDLLTTLSDLLAAGNRASEIEQKIDFQRRQVVDEQARSVAARAEQERLNAQMTADLATLITLGRQQADSAQQLDQKIAQTKTEQKLADQQSAALAALIAQRLQEQQEQIIADAMARAWEQALVWIQSNPSVPGVSAGHSTKYRFIWPETKGTITQGFGPTDFALEPPYGGYPHFHCGIDIAAPQGTPVLAADDGAVAAVGDGTTGYGRYVVLSHRDGLLTLYGHLEQPLVKVGDQVNQGQPIGLEGSTGNSTGPHVHFELRSGGVPTNPAPLLPPGGPGG